MNQASFNQAKIQVENIAIKIMEVNMSLKTTQKYAFIASTNCKKNISN